MSLYEERNVMNELKIIKKNWKIITILLIVLIIIYSIIFLLPKAMPKEEMINISLEKQNIKREESTIMNVKIKNIFNEKITDIKINTKAIDEKSISVYPNEKEIKVLGEKENRILEFNILPLKEALSGTYIIKISVTTKNKTYEKETSINVIN